MRVGSVLLALLVVFVFLVDCAPHVRVRVQDLLRQRLVNAEQQRDSFQAIFKSSVVDPAPKDPLLVGLLGPNSDPYHGTFQRFKEVSENKIHRMFSTTLVDAHKVCAISI